MIMSTFAGTAGAADRISIDVSRAPRKLPIAVMDLAGPKGKDISQVIRDDLEFSGLFAPLPAEAFIETPTEPFKGPNWAGTGAEAVVKGTVTYGEMLNVIIRLYDVFDGKLLMERKYSSKATLIRPMAHAVANDIYFKVTGQEGVFRSKIVFIAQSGQAQELKLADWDGGRSRSLGLKASAFMVPRWSPDSKNLIYSAQRGKSWSIYELSFTERKEHRIFSGPGLNLTGDYMPDQESFTLSSSRKGSPDIYIYEKKNRKLKRLTSRRSIEVSPAVSPDDSSIAYVSDRSGNPQIYTMDKLGYNKSRITFEGKYNTSPTWSPKGDLIAYSGRYEGKNQIFTIRPDGTDLRLLTTKGNNEEPSFSPDGRFLAFTSDRDGTKAVYIMRINGEGQIRITPQSVKAFGPRWSPN
jgi:TolB protein